MQSNVDWWIFTEDLKGSCAFVIGIKHCVTPWTDWSWRRWRNYQSKRITFEKTWFLVSVSVRTSTLVMKPWFISNLMQKILIYLHIIHLLKSSTCFEHYCAHLQEVYVVIVYVQPLVSSLSAGDCPVHRLRLLSCAPVKSSFIRVLS